MKTLAKTISREFALAESVLIEVIRISKLSNPNSMIGITEGDMDYLIKNISRDYLAADFERGKQVLDSAIRQFFALSQKESKICLGDFTRLCYAEANRLKEHFTTQSLINPSRNLSQKGVMKTNIEQIKKMLHGIIKPLPYNKNIRVNSIGEDEDRRRALGTQLIDSGIIPDFESVENAELRVLYCKAWTQGIDHTEKTRLYQLSPKIETNKFTARWA